MLLLSVLILKSFLINILKGTSKHAKIKIQIPKNNRKFPKEIIINAGTYNLTLREKSKKAK